MKIAVSSDQFTNVVQSLLDELRSRDHTVIYIGPEKTEEESDWTDVTLEAAQMVARKEADEAIVFCWTGTGASIAANKIRGVRAALCVDAETAKGARIWNHANILALSLRLISIPVMREILDAWFATPFSDDAWNTSQIAKISRAEMDQHSDN